MCFQRFFSKFSSPDLLLDWLCSLLSDFPGSQTQWVPPLIHQLPLGAELLPDASSPGSSTRFPVLRLEIGCHFSSDSLISGLTVASQCPDASNPACPHHPLLPRSMNTAFRPAQAHLSSLPGWCKSLFTEMFHM